MNHSIKQNDRRPAAATILKRGSTPVPLQTATSVTFKMRQRGRVTNKVSAAAVVTDAPNGAVEYQWAPGDTDTAANFRASWTVLWPDGTEETFPTIGYDSVIVNAALED